jgi:hypothetical protein
MMFTYTETETAENRRDKLAEYVFRLHIADWEGTPEKLAEYCYRHADAMIAEGEVEEAPEEPKVVRINLDTKVRVKLNDFGRHVYKIYRKSAKPRLVALFEDTTQSEDKEGWSEFYLSDLMHAFGTIVYPGSASTPFLSDIEVVE